MFTICVDSSCKDLYFTLSKEERGVKSVVLSKSYNAFGRMNENFFKFYEDFFSECGINPIKIDKWVVITGPGSFTGIRIGISILSGLTIGYRKELIGISSLDAAAVASCKDRVSIAAKLKLDEYACKDYDFKNNLFSDIYIVKDYELNGRLLVGSSDVESLTDAILYDNVNKFYSQPSPVYVRKSEAELNFDKKCAKE